MEVAILYEFLARKKEQSSKTRKINRTKKSERFAYAMNKTVDLVDFLEFDRKLDFQKSENSTRKTISKNRILSTGFQKSLKILQFLFTRDAKNLKNSRVKIKTFRICFK